MDIIIIFLWKNEIKYYMFTWSFSLKEEKKKIKTITTITTTTHTNKYIKN
jgi:hypothetical protein